MTQEEMNVLETRRAEIIERLIADMRAGLPAGPIVPHITKAQSLDELGKIERSWLNVARMLAPRKSSN